MHFVSNLLRIMEYRCHFLPKEPTLTNVLEPNCYFSLIDHRLIFLSVIPLVVHADVNVSLRCE